MRLAHTRRAGAMSTVLCISALAAVAPATAAPAAAGPTTVAVQVDPTVLAGDTLSVHGAIDFGPDVFVAAQDPAGDATLVPAALGGDLLGATITSDPSAPSQLSFDVDVAALPPVVGGVPDVVVYGWGVQPAAVAAPSFDENIAASVSVVEWRRTNLTGLRISPTPYTSLYRCDGPTCAEQELAGAMNQSTARLSAAVPLTALGAIPGGTLDALPAALSVRLGTGQRSLALPLPVSDSADLRAYRIPSRIGSVKIALVPAGSTDLSAAQAVTPEGAGETGTFSTELPTAGLPLGWYDVLTQACWGTNCDTTRRAVRVAPSTFVGVETLRMDTFDASNAPLPTVATSEALSAGDWFDVTVSGTFSRWAASSYASKYHNVCGTPDDAPMDASPGTTNGKAGGDAETMWAYVRSIRASGVECSIAVPTSIDVFQMDLGAGRVDPVPVGGPVSAPSPDRSYTYRVQGEGAPAAFTLTDCCTADNYGVLTITVQRTSQD